MENDNLISRQIYDSKFQEFIDEREKEGMDEWRVKIIGAALELFGRKLFGQRQIE